MKLLTTVWCFLFGVQQMVVDWFSGFKVVLNTIFWKTCEDFGGPIVARLLMLPWTSQVVNFKDESSQFFRQINICFCGNYRFLISHPLVEGIPYCCRCILA